MRALACSALLLVSFPALADREVVHRVGTSAAAPAVHVVTIAIPTGDIRVRTGAAGSIIVDGAIRLRYDSKRREEMQQIVNDIGLKVDIDGDHATIYRTFGPNAGSWRARHMAAFETTIDLPPGVGVRVETRVGEVRLDGAFGDVDADLHAGELVLRMPKSGVRTLEASVLAGENHLNLGDRVITREGLFSGRSVFKGNGRADVRLHVTAGELHVTLVP